MKTTQSLITLLFISTAASLHGQSVSAPLLADTYIRTSAATTNFGSDGTMLVGNVTSDPFSGLLRFDLANVNALGTLGLDYTINSVTLTGTTLTSSGGSGTGFDLAVYEYGFDFVEGGATWNDPDGVAGGDTTAGGTAGNLLSAVTVANAATLGQTIIFADSAAFQTSISNALSEGSINFLVRRDSTAGARFVRFQQDDGVNANPFELSIDYSVVPEPASFALLSGFLALGSIMLRRRRP